METKKIKRQKSSREETNLKKTYSAKKKLKLSSVANDEEETQKAEYLTIETIREGMLLLGCIIEVRSNRIQMSLPGCLVGTLPITNISKDYTENLKDSSMNELSEEESLTCMYPKGAVYPCKVVEVIRKKSNDALFLYQDKPTIILTIDPEAVNSNLRLSLLYTNMVLYAAVSSVEDHGYCMETGLSEVKGFLPFESANSGQLLGIGQVVPTFINKLPNKKNTGNVISLAYLNHEDSFPKVTEHSIKLSSLLPGARVEAYISEISESFIYLKCLDFDACSNAVTLNKKVKKLKEASEVTGTVLYVHPVTNFIYLHLGSLPTPGTFDTFFNLQKFDRVKNIKFIHCHQNNLFFKHQDNIGYCKLGEAKKSNPLSELSANPVVPKARVLYLHYVDNLVHLSLNNAFLDMKIIRSKDVKVGDIFESTVKLHGPHGVFVSICPGLSGYMRYILFSDSYVTKPEKLHPVGSKLQCRVLSRNSAGGCWTFTCKESLVSLPRESLLDSYEKAVPGEAFKGVIVKMTNEYFIVLFFNDVKGILSSDHIPKSAVFYEGQTVTCVVISCNAEKKKLKLSMNFDMLPIKKMLSQNNKKNNMENEVCSNASTKKSAVAVTENENLKTLPIEIGKPYKAFVKKITAHQINLLVNGSIKGRIHITQSGCRKEDKIPLKNFTVGQRLKIYVLKTYERRSRNYLAISHQNKTSFLECSYTYPPAVPLDYTFKSGDVHLGFVKKVYDTSALVWLSPDQCGTLDFVNMSENPKELRKLKKRLKIGESLEVTTVDVSSSANKDCKEIKLSRPGISVPETGKNIVGLLTVASSDRELVLKLPHDYSGFVCPTDIQDVYISLSHVLEKLRKLKFLSCHVLEVDHNKKVCYLSLRKSRLQGKELKSGIEASPELTENCLEKGITIKGYIRAVSSTHVIVNIGHKLCGKALFHKCSKYGCTLCLKTAEAVKTFVVGNVLQVVVDDNVSESGFIPLSLTNSICSEDNILKVGNDIDWNDLQ